MPLVPVEYDPFAEPKETEAQAPAAQSLVPVDYDPFEGQQAPQTATSTPTPSQGGYVSEAAKGFAEGAKGGVASSMVAAGIRPALIDIQKRARQIAREKGFTHVDQYDEALTLARQEYDEGKIAAPDIRNDPLVKAGQKVAEFGSDVLKPAPGWEGSLTRDIGSGFGSVASNIALGMAVPAAAPALMMSQGAGEATLNAMKNGATDDQIRRATYFGTIAGATDLADMILVSTGSTGKALGLIEKVGRRLLTGAVVEGGQEGLQQFIQNLIAKNIYKPDQDVFEDVPRNMLVGAIVGGSTKVASGAFEEQVDPPGRQATPQEIAAAGGQFSSGSVAPSATPTPAAATPTEAPPPVEPALPIPGAEPTTVSSNVIDFLSRKAAPLTADPNERPTESDDPNAPAREDILATPGANVGRLALLLGPKLYGSPKDMTAVSVKEMVQNSFDAIKGQLEKGLIDEGSLDIDMNYGRRSITVRDNGTGMAPETLAGPFLQIAGTKKESERSSGGLGIAKMLFLFGNKSLRVTTMRDGKVSELNSTGEQLFNAMSDAKQSPRINVREPTAQDRKLFPKGHGTAIEVVVPEKYKDDATGEMHSINFFSQPDMFPVLKNSPLFDNIEVRMNGQPLRGMGKHFPASEYTQFANVNFDWGTARIYVSQEPHLNTWGENLHVLSNGLWQFDTNIKKDPGKPYGENVQRRFFVDVVPKVKPEHSGYPFDLNRQQFSPIAKKAFENIFKYLSLAYQQEEYYNSVQNFGDIQYLQRGSDNRVVAGAKMKLEPKTPRRGTPAGIKSGDKIEVKDGQLIVNGRKIPELTGKDLENFSIKTDDLKVDQSEVDARSPILHDNILVEISPVEKRSITDLGREKFGARFDQFMFELGDAFVELRDVVADLMFYPALKAEGIGISFDPEYRGVSIRVPFAASFVNPAATKYTDPVRAGVGLVGTMVHELAHHQVRSHNAEFPAEMQDIMIQLDASTGFDFHAFKQKVVRSVNAHQDILTYLNGLVTSNSVQLTGKRLDEPGSYETRDGVSSSDVARLGQETGSGRGVPVRPQPSGGTAGGVEGRANPNLRLAPKGAVSGDAAQRSAQAALNRVDPGVQAAKPQPEHSSIRRMMDRIFDGTTPPPVEEMAAHADKMNRFYKWMVGLDRLVDRNPLFTPLVRYYEKIQIMHREESAIQDMAVRVAKQWRRLGAESEQLTAMLDDMANMVYRTPAEIRKGVERHPTEAEFAALVNKHKLSNRGLVVYRQVRTSFDSFLQLLEKNAVDAAQRNIKDPDKLLQTVVEVQAKVAELRDKPYFPFMQFGRHFVTVKNAAGDTVYFSTFEKKGIRSAEAIQMAKVKEMRNSVPSDHVVTHGVLPESVQPMIGMPPTLLNAMREELNLTEEQIQALDQLRYKISPESSFARLFQQKNYTPGYSDDFLRAYSRYFFHGAKYFARSKFGWALRGDIATARAISNDNKAHYIADYMQDHLTNTVLNSQGDYGYFKGAIFLWTFGYSVAGATVNLSQVPMITFPFLAAKFGGIGIGDARATKALTKAMTNWKNFYKRGTYDRLDGFEMKAIAYGIKTGRISETQAAELAALAQGHNLLGLGSNRSARNMNMILEKAAFMFEMAEQFNRRVTFSAALDLARKHTTSKGVTDAVEKYNEEYQSLLKTHSVPEARAIIAAIHAVEQTQYVYARYARPRFMRGRTAGTIFVFKHYMLSTLYLLGANKKDVLPRYLLIMMAMSGLMGLPGMEDAEDVANILSKWMFGKDFKLRNEVREFVVNMTNGKVDPSIILHGLSRKGFGIPAMAELMGIKGVPSVDMSGSLGMGNLLPVDLGKISDPGKDPNKAISEQGQRASGAVFGLGFNFYKFLFDKDYAMSDAKRWERVIPRALAGASRGYRAFNEERERTGGGPNSGSTVIKYDPRDPNQMAEVIALTLGFQPTRLRAKWDYIIAKNEAETKVKIEREMLLKQFNEARLGKKPEELDNVRKAIRDFNAHLPDYAKGMSITGETVQKSMTMRAISKAKRENDIPTSRNAAGMTEHFRKLFPDAVDVQKR